MHIPGPACRCQSDGSISVPNGSVLMQFTGLTDAKGVEIYEGDIIARRGSRFVVHFDAHLGAWMIARGSDYAPYEQLAAIEERSRNVLGNIWEKPELLGS